MEKNDVDPEVDVISWDWAISESDQVKEEYFEVTNKSYRDYRDDHGMGYNYHVYSTLNIQPVNIELSL